MTTSRRLSRSTTTTSPQAPTFDDTAVTVDDRRSWFARFGAHGPYRLLVADDDGTIDEYATKHGTRISSLWMQRSGPNTAAR